MSERNRLALLSSARLSGGQPAPQLVPQAAPHLTSLLTPQLTLFYDRACAICRDEMARLARWDGQLKLARQQRGETHGGLAMIDSSAPGFNAGDYGFTAAALDRELHAITADGAVLRGLEAIRRAYALTRYGWLWRVTAWPGLKPGFDRFYLWFARNRLAISRYTHFGRRRGQGCTDACARKLTGAPS